MRHELRTPLNAILGFGRLLQMSPVDRLPPRERGYVDQIVRAGEHLLTLIDDVLDLARVEAGQVQMALAPVPLGPLIAECLAMVRPIAQLQQVRLFQEFERLDAAQSSVPGTGIGLALSRRLVTLMQGCIGVHSEVGVGSRFWVELPLAQGAATAPQPPH